MPQAANDHDGANDREARINAMSASLLEAFGVEACIVIERQIAAADDDDVRSTWVAIWDQLCSPTARHVKS